MKTSTKLIVFTEKDVLRYCEAIGDESKIYQSEQYAKAQGLKTIPLPLTMPLVMYQLFTIPWRKEGLLIHRKQKCLTYQRMFIGEEYAGYLALTDDTSRKSYIFRRETLYIHDRSGNLCFEGTSNIVLGDVL